MIGTTYGGVDIYLLDNQPDWRGQVRLDVDVVSDLTAGLTNREARRGFSNTIRVSKFSYSATAFDGDARTLQDSLRNYQTQPVAVPLWPAAVLWSDRASMPITGGLKIAYKSDFSQWEIYEGSEPSWPSATDYAAPLLYGRLEKRDLQFATAETCGFNVEFVEASKAAWAITPGAVTWDDGPALAWGTPKLFPFRVNFDQPKLGFEVTIQRQQIGFGRIPQVTLYPQTSARSQEQDYSLTDAADISKLLRFFYDKANSAFWLSQEQSAVVLTAPIWATDDVIEVEDTSMITVGDWLCFTYPSSEGSAVKFARTIDKDDTSVTLDAAVGAWGIDTLVSQLMLARFEKSKVTVSWSDPTYATASLPMRELPPEYTPASDETIGATLGELTKRCWLYEFSRTLDSTVYTDYYTSAEADLTYGGHTYLGKSMSHEEIKGGLFLDRDDVSITQEILTGSALVKVATLKMEAPLHVTIRQATLGSGVATDASVIFTGEVVGASVKGGVITSKAVTGGTMFDRKVPRPLFQLGCNNALFDVGCGLLKANWKFTATVSAVGSAGYPFEFELSSLARVTGSTPTYSANWFAGGWIELNASGSSWQRRPILLSTNPVAGVLTVTLDRDPDPFPSVSDSVILYPGCDLTAATCAVKFDNYLNFFGHPFMPVGNPSLVKRNQSSGGGKK